MNIPKNELQYKQEKSHVTYGKYPIYFVGIFVDITCTVCPTY